MRRDSAGNAVAARSVAHTEAHRLIDEYRIYVQPVIIGKGVPLFHPDDNIDLTLIESRAFDNGVTLLRYR